MGRTKKGKKPSLKEMPGWIFKLDIETTANNPKHSAIAFMSGLERTYYPEDAGYSKFALVYQTSGFEYESPPCTFVPQSNLLTKPISNKGYGIGGLSAARFPPLNTETKTSPDKYQPELVKPLLKHKRRPIPEDEDVFRLPPNDPFVLRKRGKAQFERNLQCYVTFGISAGTPKFGKPPDFNTAGVGSYNLAYKASPKREFTPTFGRSPLVHKPSTDIQCVFEKKEKCIECGDVLHVTDYYRTRFSVKVPWPETRPIELLEKDFPRGMKHVNLCKYCYYNASRGKSRNWPKNKLRFLFRKTRTCSFMHDHQGLPDPIKRVDCATLKRLRRKEAMLSKYYADRVEESIYAELELFD